MNRQKLFSGLLLLGLLWLAGCGSAENTPQAQAVARGADLYALHCAACHGANLEGQPDWKIPNPDGTFRAPPHDETGHTWHHGDTYLRERIRYGTATLPPDLQAVSNMPAYDGVLSDADVEAVLLFIKSRWPDNIQSLQTERTAAESP